MWRLLKYLITGSFHEHEWETIKSGKRYRNNNVAGEMPSGYWYDVRCKKCGKITCFNT